MARFALNIQNVNRSRVAKLCNRLAHLALFAAWLMPLASLTFAAGIKLDVDACPTKPKVTVPIGELLAQAEDLREAANRLRQYDYDRCYRLGRSCFTEVDSKQMTGVEDASYKACRLLETTDRTNQAIWLEKKKAFIGCVIDNLEKRAEALERGAKGNDGTDGVTASLEQLKSRPGSIDAATLRKLGGDVTWCSTRDPSRVRVLCKDCTGLLANAQGHQFMLWRVDPSGHLCFVDFDGLTTCRSVSVNDGLLTLTSADGQVDDVIKIVPRIGQSWSEGCSR
ncbi:hypothetical protein [Bradyrhizobium australafricanum]|uniref:hypothetical protein n=1 Tax=Bradyrhizobium australafricanum TaxID=2821406 RepID=UPI001CE36692|nr:hypothetical protein [Bradyrhizobium australafricanum]MCA6098185.1 hypothetical protein [Bradyrhizobium australafricanum]